MKHLFLRLRARCGVLWRFGVIDRATALRWDVDAGLNEWTRRTRREGL